MNQTDLVKFNLRPLRLDAMPSEVATAYLASPFTRMTGAFRRTCNYARASYYVSTNSPKPQANRFSRRSIDWIVRHLRRTEQRIRIVQGELNRVSVEHIKSNIVQNTMMPLLARGKSLVAEIRRRELSIEAKKGIALGI